MKKKALAVLFALITVLVMALPALAAKPAFGMLYYNGGTVRTVVPPAAMPQAGVDDFYVVTNAAEGQLGIAAVAPGDTDYHGGKWAFHTVTFNEGVDPVVLTSAAAVLDAEANGLVTVVRVPENDFKCPIQP